MKVIMPGSRAAPPGCRDRPLQTQLSPRRSSRPLVVALAAAKLHVDIRLLVRAHVTQVLLVLAGDGVDPAVVVAVVVLTDPLGVVQVVDAARLDGRVVVVVVARDRRFPVGVTVLVPLLGGVVKLA